MRFGWVAVALLFVASTAMGALQLRQDVAAVPSALAPPVTLASAASGSTSLGASATSATTSVSIGLSTLNVLKVHKVTGNWDVKVSLVSASGFSVLESATVALVGASTQTQVVVTLGSVVQSIGTAVALTGSDITITVAATLAATAALGLNVVLVPQGGSGPTLLYSYTLTLG
ncbi:MAG: hypothetical protein AABX89_06360 [Candidatus Thermoplasmatota archaeon]